MRTDKDLFFVVHKPMTVCPVGYRTEVSLLPGCALLVKEGDWCICISGGTTEAPEIWQPGRCFLLPTGTETQLNSHDHQLSLCCVGPFTRQTFAQKLWLMTNKRFIPKKTQMGLIEVGTQVYRPLVGNHEALVGHPMSFLLHGCCLIEQGCTFTIAPKELWKDVLYRAPVATAS